MTPASWTAGFAGSRPVGDAPVDALVARADELAGRWASALVGARPLAEIATVPLERVGREGPALCAQLIRALSSDVELERLLAPAAEAERSTPGRSGALAACLASERDPSSVVRDVEVLREVVWRATLGELGQPTAALVGDLSDRLAWVCAALLAATLEQQGLAGAAVVTETPSAAAGRERVLYSSPRTSPGGRRAVLIDEREEIARPAVSSRDASVIAAYAATPSHESARMREQPASERVEDDRTVQPTAPRPRPWDTPLNAVAPSAGSLGDPAPRGPVPDGRAAEMRVRRTTGAPVDDRA